ncbi:hypothetical protein [Desulfonatronum parangueonense]
MSPDLGPGMGGRNVTIQHTMCLADYLHRIPAFAGMRCRAQAVCTSVIPAKAGIQVFFWNFAKGTQEKTKSEMSEERWCEADSD